MKYIELTKGARAIVDDEDFDLLNQYNWCLLGKSGYAVRGGFVDGKKKMILMHRFLMNTPDGFDTDHINGQKLDNRRSNLRIVTRGENCMNAKKHSNNLSSKYKGVHLFGRTGKWTAHVHKNYKKIHLGYFDTELQAVEAYNKKALEMYGDKAKLNVVG